MAKAYVITRGEYSDYRIWGIFNYKKKAIDTCNELNRLSKYKDYRIEEYELNINIFKPEYQFYYIFIDDDKTDISILEPNSYQIQNLNRVLNHKPRKEKLYYSVVVQAKSDNHAVKIASDLVRAYKVDH